MTSLPKRGDRVRVTEVAWGDTLPQSLVGQELTLEFDLQPLHRTPGFLELPVPYSACRPAAVKVEILERAGASACWCSDYMSAGAPCPPGKCPNAPKPKAPEVHPEFARGMRRAVAIAACVIADTSSVDRLSAAIEKELKP